MGGTVNPCHGRTKNKKSKDEKAKTLSKKPFSKCRKIPCRIKQSKGGSAMVIKQKIDSRTFRVKNNLDSEISLGKLSERLGSKLAVFISNQNSMFTQVKNNNYGKK